MPPKKKKSAPFIFPRTPPAPSPQPPWLGLETPTGLLQRAELEEFGVGGEDWLAATDDDKRAALEALQAAWVVRAAAAALISERLKGAKRPSREVTKNAKHLLVAARHPKTGFHAYARRRVLTTEALALTNNLKPLVEKLAAALKDKQGKARQALLVKACSEANEALHDWYGRSAPQSPPRWLAAFNALDPNLPKIGVADLEAAMAYPAAEATRLLVKCVTGIGTDELRRGKTRSRPKP